jgi:hypothetical protein
MSTIQTEEPSDGEQWKEKYRDAVRELDAKEKHWRDSEIRLQKTLLCLSFSYKGLDPSLDNELKHLQAALKKSPDSKTRRNLINDILDKITRLNSERDGHQNSNTAPGLFVTWLAENLQLPESHTSERDLISAKLKEANESTLKKGCRHLANLVCPGSHRQHEYVVYRVHRLTLAPPQVLESRQRN